MSEFVWSTQLVRIPTPNFSILYLALCPSDALVFVCVACHCIAAWRIENRIQIVLSSKAKASRAGREPWYLWMAANFIRTRRRRQRFNSMHSMNVSIQCVWRTWHARITLTLWNRIVRTYWHILYKQLDVVTAWCYNKSCDIIKIYDVMASEPSDISFLYPPILSNTSSLLISYHHTRSAVALALYE